MQWGVFDCGFESGGVFNLTPGQAMAMCGNGAVLIDVREADMNRFKMFEVPEVIYCPFSLLEERYTDLPSDKPLIFADSSGLHSREATLLMQQKGMGERVANLAGGLVEWERDGLPVVVDKSERLTGSCMCQLRPRDKK